MRKFYSAIAVIYLTSLLSTGCRAAPEGLSEIEVGDMRRRVAALEKRQASYVDTIIQSRKKYASSLDKLGLSAWAKEHLRQTDAYLAVGSIKPDSKPFNPDPTASREWKRDESSYDVRQLFSVNEREPVTQRSAVTLLVSLVIWGVMAGVWITALATVSRLRKRKGLSGIVRLVPVPVAAVLLCGSGFLGSGIEGRRLLPFYAAPGSILVLLLGFIGYLFVRVLQRRAWIGATAMVSGVIAICFCSVYFVAIPAANNALRGIDCPDVDGPLHVGWPGTVSIKGIRSSEEAAVRWSVDGICIRPNVLALLWGKLGDVVIDLDEVTLKIDTRRLAEREPSEAEDLSLLLDELTDWARSVASVSAGRLLVQIPRGAGEDVWQFDGHGCNLLMHLKGEEAGGEIHGVFRSFGNVALSWRADLDTQQMDVRFNVSEATIQTDMLSDLLGEGVDMEREGWLVKGGVKAAGKAHLSMETGVDWSMLLDFSGCRVQLPGLPAPFDNLHGQVELEPDGAEIVGISGQIQDDSEAHIAVRGNVGWDGNGYLDVVSLGFPLRKKWLSWATESAEWLEQSEFSGRIDFYSALKLWPAEGGIEVTNVRTRVFPRQIHMRHTETGIEAAVELSRVVADTEKAETIVGDGIVAGGRLFGYIHSAFSTTERSSGWIALTNANLSSLLKRKYVGGLLNAEVDIGDISFKSPVSAEGFAWVDDVNITLVPVISRLVQVLKISPLHHKTADAYCVFKAGKGGFEIVEARFASPVTRIHITGSVGFDGRLNLMAVTYTGESIVRRVPVLGYWLERAAKMTWRGLIRTEIRGTINNPWIVPVPFGNIASDVLDFFSR